MVIKQALYSCLMAALWLVTGHAYGDVITLVDEKRPLVISVGENEPQVVKHAARMLADDIAGISGVAPEITNNLRAHSGTTIIAGTLGSNGLANQYYSVKDPAIVQMQGQWEQYRIWLNKDGDSATGTTIIVVGSDRRGTAYGLLAISRMLGVSPWSWWADVAYQPRFPLKLELFDTYFTGPSVAYRGIFINDEDWGIQRWAATHFEPEVGDMGPKTYSKIFELLLRLRANTIWPAMHSTTTPFYNVPGNKEAADDYAIVIGTSHAEPMLSNINGEWDHASFGPYRYDTNADAVKSFFKKRAQQTAGFENLYTVGMRGEHDSPIITEQSDIASQVSLMEQILSDQRTILSETVGRSAATIPQVFIPYKEVLTLYQAGLDVADDVTLMWTDDNYGYIRQLSNKDEQQRSGNAGIYYHTSYWGRPHDYLWLNSTHPLLMWSELNKAYEYQAQKIWILNVGDIKPHEHQLELFMDMAWNIDAFSQSDAVYTRMTAYFARDIGVDVADAVTSLFKDYYHLSLQRRPEFMAWSSVEPVTLPKPTALSQTHYGDEVSQRIAQWQALLRQLNDVTQYVGARQQDAFFELAEYPLRAAAQMNLKWLWHYKQRFAADQGRGDTAWFGQQMQQSADAIAALTAYYQTQLANGKWQAFMSDAPRSLPVFDTPATSGILPNGHAQDKVIDVMLEGHQVALNNRITNSHADSLPLFNVYTRQPRYIDLALTNNQSAATWALTVSEPWITLSQSKGTLTTEQPTKRIWVTLDWDKVPAGKPGKEPPLGHDHQLIPPGYKVTGEVTITTQSQSLPVHITAFNPAIKALADFDGYVEDSGFVSFNAGVYQNAQQTEHGHWQVMPDFGYSNQVMLSQPYQAELQNEDTPLLKNAPVLQYDFYTFNTGDADIWLQVLPTHPANTDSGVKLAVAIDDHPPHVVDFATKGRSKQWMQNVLTNAARQSTSQPITAPGKHTLSIWMIDGGVMLDSLLIDLGGWKSSYAFPPATYSPTTLHRLNALQQPHK